MQPYLWLWILLAPPLLALIDLATAPAISSFGRRARPDGPERM